MLAVVKGRHNEESELKKFEDSQQSSDRHDGCRYFVEKSQVNPGIDPIDAIQQRQAELEKRESKALRDTTTPIVCSPEMKPVYSLGETDDDNLQIELRFVDHLQLANNVRHRRMT